jgi:hypothetical protein
MLNIGVNDAPHKNKENQNPNINIKDMFIGFQQS